jgi:hypothetical protein
MPPMTNTFAVADADAIITDDIIMLDMVRLLFTICGSAVCGLLRVRFD